MDSVELKVLPSDSARGDFYVDAECCVFCGVPQAVAPDLVGWTDNSSSQCHWKKQPETPEELERAIGVLEGQEVGCHRYAGRDPEIQLRIGSGSCDFRDAWPVCDASLLLAEVEPPRLWTEPTFWEQLRSKVTHLFKGHL